MNWVERDGHLLVLDGKPFYVNGWNSYWLMVQASESGTRSRVDRILHDGAALGLTVCRTWAFNDDTYQALQVSPGKYDEKVFQGLDYAVYQAQCSGVRLMLSFANNWKDYGGKAKYVEWAKAARESCASDDDFFRNSKCRQWYKDHVKAVLTRVNTFTKVEYRNDPAIFAWELMNEPQCPSDKSGDAVKAWIGEMALHVKSLDDKHLLTVGSEGFYCSNSRGCCSSNPNSYAGTLGTDFVQDHQLPGIDFATVHAYPDAWLSSQDVEDKLKFFDSWVKAHIEDSEKVLRMPVLFTEFGLSDRKAGFSPAKQHEFYRTVYDQVYESAQRQGAAAGTLLWQLLPNAMMDWNDGYGFDPAHDSLICNTISQHSARLHSVWNTPSCSKSSEGGIYGNKTPSPSRHSVSSIFKKSLNHIFK